MKKFFSKPAFTLAEVVITLSVLGVVAAIVLPPLNTNINERLNSEVQANTAYKITKAMESMHALKKLRHYDSTDAFVDELQKYIKIAKRCDANHIAECWPTETVINSAGEEYNVADCKRRRNLLGGSSTNGDNVGLVLADGTSLILTYDTSSRPISVWDEVSPSKITLPVGRNKTKDFAYTSSVTAPIDFIMDTNGKKGPNSETVDNKWHDIRSFKMASFSSLSCENYNGVCIIVAGTASTWAPVECDEPSIYDYTKYCGPTPSGLSNDYWAGAKKLCAESGMTLPTVSQLQSIYENRANYPTALAAYQSSGWFWSSEEDSHDLQLVALGVSFDSGNASDSSKESNPSSHMVLCVDN